MSFEMLSDTDSIVAEKETTERVYGNVGVHELGQWLLLVILIFICYNPLVAEHLFGASSNTLLQALVTATIFAVTAFVLGAKSKVN